MERFIDILLKRPALSIAVGIAAISSLGILAWYIFDNALGTDFAVYWRAANEPLKAVYAPRDSMPFPYSPPMLLWIAPLSLMPKWLTYVSFVTLSLTAFVVACRAYLTRAEIALAVLSAPTVYAVVNGQVTLILTAALLWASGTKRRAWAGVAFAVIASVKPQLVILAPLLLLIIGDWNALVVAALTFAAIVVASLAIFGIETWAAWIMSLDNFHSVLVNRNVLNIAATPAGVAESWGLPPLPFLLVGTVAGSWLVGRCRNLAPLHKSAAVAAGSLLAAPYALMYDLTAVVPFLVWAIFRGSIPAAVAMGGALNPLPLALTAWTLSRRTKSDRPRKLPPPKPSALSEI